MLRGWAKSLESLDVIERDLIGAAESFAAFHVVDNMKQLVWLEPNADEQWFVARSVLQCFSSSKPSDAYTDKSLAYWRREIQIAHEDRRFRVP